MFTKLEQWYLSFLEKDKRNFFESVFYFSLYLLSFIYGIVVFLRNFFYNQKIIPSYSLKAKIISVGNLSWSGSGKTPLSIWLYEKFSSRFRVAILRRGYGSDEDSLLKERVENAFSLPDRYKLAKELEPSFDIFILDDGFQYRRLKKNVNIVIMGAREFRKKYRLIPAYFFREPLTALKRADIVILNHIEEIKDPSKIKDAILKAAPNLRVYFSRYKFRRFSDLDGNELSQDFFKNRKIAALAGIGYPQGFFNKLREVNLEISHQITYPDHHQLSESEFSNIQESLLQADIKDLVITHKDKYHLPSKKTKLNISVMEIDIEIEDEDNLMEEINKELVNNNAK